MQLILKYFPFLLKTQIDQFKQLESLYNFWNKQINIISRKDISHFYERHVLHSLSIAKVFQFKHKMQVLDIGTGGGFPGIPLAILFPETSFHLVDSIGKKIKVVKDIANHIQLNNVNATQMRIEDVDRHFDFIVSRAVAPLIQLHQLSITLIPDRPSDNNTLGNGLICLKGGNLTTEIRDINKPVSKYPISNYFKESFFQNKYILHLPIHNG